MKKMKRALALLLSAGMLISSINVPSFATELGSATGTSERNVIKVTKPVTEAFDDIKEGAWYEDAVQYVYDNGLMSGSNGNFKPNESVTRAMVVATLYRLEGSPEIADDTACDVFGDVERGKWYADALCWAYNNGIASGNTKTLQFNANNPVTREQLATFIYRYAEYKDFDTTQVGDLSELLNVGQMNQYAREAVVWAVGAGLISGVELMDDMGNISYDLAPQASASRAQLASILMRFCESYEITMSDDGIKNNTTTIPNITTSNPTAVKVSPTPRYFPVTMYNYDGDAMNALTRQIEFEQFAKNGGTLEEWKGMYFTNGEQSRASFDYSSYVNKIVTYEKVVNASDLTVGDSYVLVSRFMDGNQVRTYAVGSYVTNDGGRLDQAELVDLTKTTLQPSEVESAAVWQYDGSRLYYMEGNAKQYINILSHTGNKHNVKHAIEMVSEDNKSTAAVVKTLQQNDANAEPIFLIHDEDACNGTGCYLNQVDNASTVKRFGGWDGTNSGSQFALYKRVERIDLDNPGVALTINYVKETTSTLEEGVPYVFVCYGSPNQAVGTPTTNGSAGRMSGSQSITGTIAESSLEPNTLKWQRDAEGYVYYLSEGEKYYMNIPCNCGDDATHKTTKHPVEVTTTKEGSVKLKSDATAGVFFLYDADGRGTYLNYVDANVGMFGGWFNPGNFSKFYAYKRTAGAVTSNMQMADYNLWTGFVPWDPTQADNPLGGSLTAAGTIGSNPGEEAYNKKGNRLYNHLVKSSLDANNNIQFNVPEPGIFSLEETDYRQVYTNVEMPFQYDLDNGVYTFDSSKMSARFKNGIGQDNSTLEYATTPQASDKTYGDGSSTMWMPYNDVNSLANVTKDYHFGMTFSIPFFMTADGKLPGGAYKDIVFEFSGDDDIWVFIDGQLVLDMGGIHNNLYAKINFAENTWSVYRNPDTNIADQELSYVDGAATSGTLFATAENTHDGIISMTRAAFAQTEVHTLTVFYLERGSGSSNNMISFNLPMRDSVNVMKEVSATDKQGNTLSNEMLSYINQRDFKFKLTNNGKAVEKNYYLMDIRGIYLQTLKTNADGEFTLKNGQTAKFVGPLTTGDNYVATEIEDEATTAWTKPDWYSISRLGEPITEVKETTDEQWSCEPVEIAEGFPQYMESVNIRCTNTLDLDGKPEINDDRIVIDYGLPVEIDVFKNDIVPVSVELDFDNVSLSNDGDGTFGTAVYDSATRKIKYTLTEQLTTAEKFVYTVPYTNDAGKSGEVSATLWIMPATSMYYEEDFGFVTYTGNWSALGTATNALQEPGVVGTLSDSTYGSDAAYLDDSNDSNGTSKYVKTTAENGAGFSYTFTGTGTTFFARTTNNSGYMKVDIECIDSDTTTTYIDQWRRDTSYKTDDAGTTLYNIPVFSWTAEEYGTYKVTVSLAKYVTNPKTGKQLYGTEFWLDGIKVFEPSDPSAADAAAVNSAYAADGEANVDVVTLRNKLIQNQMIYDEATQSYTWSEQDKENGNFVVFTDFKKTEDGQSYEAGSQEIILAEDYISRGPKEEVYLQSGQSVSFMLKDWDPNGAHVYLGIKAPMGAGTVLVNGNELSINNSVDAYYDISNYRDVTTHADGTENAKFVITAGADSLISLTNIKATGGTEYTILSPVGTPDESAVEPMNEDIHVTGAEGADPLPGTNGTL